MTRAAHCFALVSMASLAGCPDATQGKSPGDLGSEKDPTAPGASSSSGGAGAGGGGAAVAMEAGAPGVRQTLAAISGTLALGAADVYVATVSGVVRVAKTGGSSTTTLAGAATWMHASPTHLYVARPPPTRITEAELDGASPRTLAIGSEMVDGRAGIGTENGHVQWVSASSASVWSTDRTSGATTKIREGDLGTPVVYLAATARDLVYGVQMCGGCGGAQSRSFSVVRSGLDGNTQSTLADAEDVLSLRADARAAVWLEKGAGIRGVALDGSPSPRAITGAAELFDCGVLALDATHVYWATRASGRIYRALRDGGTPEIFAEGFQLVDDTEHQVGLVRDNAQRLVLDEQALYVSDRDGVYRIAK